MADVVKIFNNVATGVKSVNTIVTTFDKIDKSVKENNKKILKPRVIMDISILQTILERLENIAVLIIQYHTRDGGNLNKKEKQRLAFVVEEVECIYDHAKALMMANALSSGSTVMRI
ncbi:Protein CBG24480 [Caenorhabditis briggsae]|uniref:Protein CBG24480 n=1 Tax=Caenorhabditis briggsae TaxID=6238 RepID=A8WKT2_CAEBR|nr:Protein CBG24480 [Caenorhabditis briggsae]CAP21077.2 Protein CBG24480 [Caenorhabditis briggsae]